MTTQAIPAVSADWKPLIPRLNFTGDAKQIAPFLDGVTSAKAMLVCKLWQGKLREPRDALLEDLICVQEGFPEEVVKAFRAKNLSLWRLPVVPTEKIPLEDYFTVSQEDMPQGASIARLKTQGGRVGFAVDVRGTIDKHIERRYKWGDESFNVRDFQGVVCVSADIQIRISGLKIAGLGMKCSRYTTKCMMSQTTLGPNRSVVLPALHSVPNTLRVAKNLSSVCAPEPIQCLSSQKR